MSQLEYYGQDPSNLMPHKSGLYAWGVVLIVLGGFVGLGALFSMLGAAVMLFAPSTRSMISLLPALLLAVLMYVVMSGVLIYLGIGSCRGRRWVRPLILIGSVLAMVHGVASLPALVWTIIDQFLHPRAAGPATPGLPANFQALALMCGGVFVLLLFVGLPAGLLWFYRRPSVQQTLDQLDPGRNWTDRCPLPVLGWSLACLQVCFGLLFLLAEGYAPFFATILRHEWAGLYSGLVIILTVTAALLCYRQSIIGWAISIAVFAMLALSQVTFAIIGDHERLTRIALSQLPAASRSQVPRTSPSAWFTSALIYVAAVVYLVWLFPFFKPSEANDGTRK